ncbi:hypothetical protein [Longibacter sp.]|jgi:hypothetical protein|uniref:hypothetical protein n=1 Tax=Longibacter sp. TaxID=2045415 RepID=UPI003EBF348E
MPQPEAAPSSPPADRPTDAFRQRLVDRAMDLLNARDAEGQRTATLSHETIQAIRDEQWPTVLDALASMRRRAMLMLWLGVIAFPVAAVMHVVVFLDLVNGGMETIATLVFSLFWIGYGGYAVFENTRRLQSIERAHTLFGVIRDLSSDET